MILITGGACQGKEQVAKLMMEGKAGKVQLNVHLLIREKCKAGKTIEEIKEEILTFVKNNNISILTIDEVGSGIVPMDAFERHYRETVGRVGCVLASKAEEVYRVTCGISVRMK